MRSFPLAIALALSLVYVSACADGRRSESSASRARDSSLSHDLALARAASAVPATARADSGVTTVAESRGSLDTSLADADASDPPSPRPTALTVSNRTTPSAEGYVGPSCASPAAEDQRRCLLGYLARSDAQLDRNYQALIDHLRAEAGTRGSAADPKPVQRLRTAQRAWLVYRDDECRKRTVDSEGPLWAPVRAQCLAEYSSLRTRELGDALAKRPAIRARPSVAKAKSSPAKRSSARKTSRTRAKRSR